MTREERRESFRKWGTFIVSTLALVIGLVRDPILWTIRASIHEQLRAELSRYETILSADARWERHNVLCDEIVKRLDNNLWLIQQAVVATQTNQVRVSQR